MFLATTSCQLASFFIGVVQVCYMSAPVGDCDTCCARDDTRDIVYKLFTRSNPDQFEQLAVGGSGLAPTNFSVTRPTVIYLFGFSEAATGPSTTTLKEAFLAAGDFNFIVVDWSRLVVFPWYVIAVQNTRYMGRRLADFVQALNSAGVPASSVHVIGFSLGAEAAGFGGKALKARGLMLGRITGLDPAYPGYRFKDKNGHLSKGDATFVDVIHTNPGVFGFPEAIGDVDFYPNAGQWVQPGCWIDQLVNNNELDLVYGCSHNRAWRLYAESLSNPAGFPATLCKNWRNSSKCGYNVDGYMGDAAQPPMKGIMYLETNAKSPFARNGP
ncbi:pancreatic triacylglycerol lipase [Aricia agestis]|uniref:pancreatic triacylglycerol lipase n=1 Tax=Aricia agestis TaxID=91739 RepID=UPI001C2058AD|nr:pancreatic triacylglycerol lipase [Aricia agestis]